jgi:diguanylate cyclase (GGDEF)-like protein
MMALFTAGRGTAIRPAEGIEPMAIYPEWVATDGGGPADPEAGAAVEPSADRTAAADDGVEGNQSGDAPAAASIPIVEAPVPPPLGWADALTGVDGPHYWDRLIISETARVRRYRRPVTVVLVEIAGLTRLGQLWGRDVAERTLVSAARTLSQSIRTSDHIARIEPIRFAIMLTETTEIDAINFIERARVSCERDLRIASEVVGVAFGWASPPKGNDLADAAALAATRLAAELKTL